MLALQKKKKNRITSSRTWRGPEQQQQQQKKKKKQKQELFWGAESITKAMTSQLCFHSFMEGGGGRRRGGGGKRKQQWLNLTGLIQAKVYINYLLGLGRRLQMGSCVCATAVVQMKHIKRRIFTPFSRWSCSLIFSWSIATLNVSHFSMRTNSTQKREFLQQGLNTIWRWNILSRGLVPVSTLFSPASMWHFFSHASKVWSCTVL